MHQLEGSASIVRTTINIEDDALAAARAYAQARALKLGQAVSDLIRRGSTGRHPVKQAGDVWVFDLPQGTPTVTSQRVKDMLQEPL
jgi:hypothetical protein